MIISKFREGAGDGTGQLPIANHAGHIQVFDSDHVEPAHQIGACLVQEVPPRIGHLGVYPGDLDGTLGAVRRTLPAAGQPPLVPLQPPFMPFPVFRVGNLFPSR